MIELNLSDDISSNDSDNIESFDDEKDADKISAVMNGQKSN